MSGRKLYVATRLFGVAIVVVFLLLIVGPSPIGHAQKPDSPGFEVASIRMVGPDHGYFKISPPGSLTFAAENVSMKLLIGLAFGIDSNLISAKQSWLDSTLYDITAKPEGTHGPSFKELQPMLRQLLSDRFGLKTHRESKMVDGYSLVVDRGGFKLKPAEESSTTPYILADGLRAKSISMRTLAGMLTSPTGRPVADKTQIEGSYDIDLSYAPPNSMDSPLPSVFTAVQAQLGLKLVSQKVAVETLVVDQVERVPTEN